MNMSRILRWVIHDSRILILRIQLTVCDVPQNIWIINLDVLNSENYMWNVPDEFLELVVNIFVKRITSYLWANK